MDRVAVFVDAGYLFVGGAKSLTGVDNMRRHELSLDVAVVIGYLKEKAEAITEQKLLRIYWYDAALSGRLSTDHQILASSNNVKLRLGVINGLGEQKGVDGRIITDMAELSRNGAFADAVLLSGDEDLRIGVELAQERGARVHLLTLDGVNPSPTLRQESDTTSLMLRDEIASFLTVRAHKYDSSQGLSLVASAIPDGPTSKIELETDRALSRTGSEASDVDIKPELSNQRGTVDLQLVFSSIVEGYLSSLADMERTALISALKTGAGVPPEHDGKLLARTRRALERPLEGPEKAKLRRALKAALSV